VTYILTLTEANQDNVAITISGFTVSGSAIVKSVSAKNGSNQYTVIVTAGSTDGAVTLTPKAGIVSDLVGNLNAASPTSPSFTIDNILPVITLNGSGTINLLLSGTYTEEGANWTDNMDGTGTITSPTTGTVNVNQT
jgi:hypothetical protein